MIIEVIRTLQRGFNLRKEKKLKGNLSRVQVIVAFNKVANPYQLFRLKN